jgi:signal transduction histidine kinase
VRIKERWFSAGLVVLALLLVLAAWLQYRWINRASQADLLERRQSLNGALAGVKGECNATIQELLPMFRPAPDVPAGVDLEARLLRLYSQWQRTANRPPLLGAVYLGEMRDGRLAFSRLNARDRKFRPQAWPESLSFYGEALIKRLRMPDGLPPYFPRGFAFELIAARPVIIFPMVERHAPPGPFGPDPPPPPRRNDRPRPPPDGEPPHSVRELLSPAAVAQPPGAPELRGWCFLELNSEYFKLQLLPSLIEQVFGANGLDNYQLAVVGGDAPEMIYQSDAALTIDALAQVDAGITLIGQETLPPSAPPSLPEESQEDRPRPPLDETRVRHAVAPPRPADNDGSRPPPPPARPLPRLPDEFRADASPGNSWRLVARHRAGSLATVVNQARRRNLALNFGIFLLLSGSMFMLALAAHRARRLARQQMEFVANITHELRTPLSVIHSASYNLASGVVSQPRRVQDYGAMIQNEARRLSAQVEQALSFAGVHANRKHPYDFQPVRITEIVEHAMNDCGPAFAEAGWQVEYEKADPAPTVLADAPAIESVIKNLLQNALKYAGRGKQLRVAVRVCSNGKRNEAQITITDRGPGIGAKDLPHIFEPFYRSADVLASATHGAGLGLSIVQSMSRRIAGASRLPQATARPSPSIYRRWRSPINNNGRRAGRADGATTARSLPNQAA